MFERNYTAVMDGEMPNVSVAERAAAKDDLLRAINAELLAALKALEWAEGAGLCSKPYRVRKAHYAARAAIAKAEGRNATGE